MKKYTIEQVREIFERENCELLSTEYKNCDQKLEYLCSKCERKVQIRLMQFKKGTRCRYCAIEKNSNKQRHTYEYVKNKFDERGYKLLENNYLNCKQKLTYLCKKCKKEFKISFSDFNSGRGCPQCGLKKRSDKRKKYNIDQVREIFKKEGCKLLSKTYDNCDTLLSYQCSCLSESKISLYCFLKGSRCLICGHKKTSEKKKIYFQEIVEEIFSKNSCKLLDKFVHIRIPLSYICLCGKKAETSILLHNFLKGQRCKQCGIKKQSGLNHWNYNPNLTLEDRIKFRNTEKWRKNVYAKDNYTCQYCDKKGGEINAHHRNSWKNFPRQRYLVDNGITFCEKHHKQFHKLYGWDSTKEKVEEFLKTKSKQYELINSK